MKRSHFQVFHKLFLSIHEIRAMRDIIRCISISFVVSCLRFLKSYHSHWIIHHLGRSLQIKQNELVGKQTVGGCYQCLSAAMPIQGLLLYNSSVGEDKHRLASMQTPIQQHPRASCGTVTLPYCKSLVRMTVILLVCAFGVNTDRPPPPASSLFESWAFTRSPPPPARLLPDSSMQSESEDGRRRPTKTFLWWSFLNKSLQPITDFG